MFLHLGNNHMLRKDRIIAILNLETAGNTPLAQSLLKNVTNKGLIKNDSEERKDKSLIITEKRAYISPISSGTLLKRSLTNADFAKF